MKKVIAICQSGGEFVRGGDGTLSYAGGEAYAVDVDGETKVEELRAELAEMFKLKCGGGGGMSIKYLLPSNRRTLISISKDKDLQRMLGFLGEAGTAELFVIQDDIDGDVQNQHDIDDDVQNQNQNQIPSSRASWDSAITGVGQRFGSFGELREALHKYSIAQGFAYRYKKNDSQRVTVKCKAPGCDWRLYASRVAPEVVSIRRMQGGHSCEKLTKGGGGGRGWVGSIVKEKLKACPKYRPKDIARDIKVEYGIHLNYSQAWRAKEIAREQLQGSFKEAYSQLPALCHSICATNPGSVASFSTHPDSTFHRLFLSFHASLVGFRLACRPLLFLHSAPLNSKYQGSLLSASAPDPDDAVFPLAFAVVDSDSPPNWHWFLSHLRSALSPCSPITFVSAGLPDSLLSELFSPCHHALCLRHLSDQLNRDLRAHFSHEARRFMVNDLHAAALAPTLDAFNANLQSIRTISPDAYEWVVGSQPKAWANAFFPGSRYNLISASFAHPFFASLSDSHELPITHLIDLLRCKLMQSFYARRADSALWTSNLAPSKEDQLRADTLAAHSLQVDHDHQDSAVYEVRSDPPQTVDLDRWHCSCNVWQLTGLPCRHAIAVIRCTGRSPYDYCSPYFSADNYRLAYAESIQPIPDLDKPSPDLALVTVTPPPTRRPPGRPKTPKPDSTDVIKRQLQCSNCKGLGHNKKTCKDSAS